MAGESQLHVGLRRDARIVTYRVAWPAMNDPLDAPTQTDAPAADESKSPKLGAGIGTIFVIASITLFLAFIAIWANRQIFDTQQWTETSTQVIEQPAVQDALANYLVDQLFTKVDVEQQIQNQLPPDLDALAGPATSGIRSLALSGTEKALELPVVQQAWATANEVAHGVLIATLEGGKGNVSTTGGKVTVDARAILISVAQKVGLSGNLVSKIPPSAGSFVIWQSADLAAAQNAYKIFKDFLWIFVILTVALYTLAIALASGRRRRAVIWMGSSFVTVALLVMITISLARTPVVDSLAQTSSVVPAVTDIYDIATQLLKQMAGSLLFTGVLVLLATLLAGPYAWAVSSRRFLAPYLRDYLPLSTAAVALIYLIAIWLVPVSGFRNAVGLVLNTVLVIAGFIALVTMTRREFPDAEAADFGAVGDWFSERWSDASGFVKERTKRDAELPSVRGGGETTTVVGGVGELERLTQLHKDGSLSDAEFEAAKQKLIDG
jgi:hypothetical protein